MTFPEFNSFALVEVSGDEGGRGDCAARGWGRKGNRLNTHGSVRRVASGLSSRCRPPITNKREPYKGRSPRAAARAISLAKPRLPSASQVYRDTHRPTASPMKHDTQSRRREPTQRRNPLIRARAKESSEAHAS